jgi:hypothetical protein
LVVHVTRTLVTLAFVTVPVPPVTTQDCDAPIGWASTVTA